MRNTESGARASRAATAVAGLAVEHLDVYYGQAHALQGVSLSLDQGVLAVVGRNGMGKTTLCKAITGMVPATGSVRFAGQQILGRTPDQITRLGIAYVPQGRRVWRSLTVDETLRLAAKTARQGAWTVERVYQVFPRLAERRDNGGAQLSGGEQQMLAIGRALLFNPHLLVMDEPTEGLAPVIVEQVAELLKALADERSMSVLLIEQNLGVALEVADNVAIMVNGRIAHCLPAGQLGADRALQQRLLGLKAGAATDEAERAGPASEPGAAPILRVVRQHADQVPTSWELASSTALVQLPGSASVGPAPAASAPGEAPLPAAAQPGSVGQDRAVYLAGAWGEQQRELAYARRCLEQLGVRVVTVDIGASGFSSAQVGAQELVRHRQLANLDLGTLAQGQGPDALADGFAAYLRSRRDLGALLVLTRAGTVDVACSGAVSLPAGVPKVLVTDQPLPGSEADVLVMTAPIGELNRVSEILIAHAASATAGMLRESGALHRASKPLVCITSLGLVEGTVRHIRRALADTCDCLVLDMAGTGAATLERLAQSGLLAGVIDLVPMDVSLATLSGDDRAPRGRLEAIRTSRVPYLLVPSLLQVAVYPPGKAIPATLLQREVVSSAADGSVVAVSRSEAQRSADWFAEQLAGFRSPTHVLLPAPSADALQKLGGGSQSVELQDIVHKGVARRIKASRTQQLTELPHTLHSARFGEFVGKAMRELLRTPAQG